MWGDKSDNDAADDYDDNDDDDNNDGNDNNDDNNDHDNDDEDNDDIDDDDDDTDDADKDERRLNTFQTIHNQAKWASQPRNTSNWMGNILLKKFIQINSFSVIFPKLLKNLAEI